MRPVLGFFALLSSGSLGLAAKAEEISANCGAFDYDKDTTRGVAAVNGAQHRVHFSKNGFDEKSCPSMNSVCEEKAYLLPGDLVVAGRVFNGFVCTSYVGTKGKETTGWLPATSLDYRAPLAKPKTGDWIGRWKGLGDTPHFVNPGDQRAEIVIERGEQGFLTLEGTVSYVIRCLVPRCAGVCYSRLQRDGLWDKFYMAAPARQRRCVEQSNKVKRA
ncbi:MAG: hypothetical protein ACREC9_09785 [Methylocella sp.]